MLLKGQKDEVKAGLTFSQASSSLISCAMARTICCHGALLIRAWLYTSLRSSREVTQRGSEGCPGGTALPIWDPESRRARNPFMLKMGGRESDAMPKRSWQRSKGTSWQVFPNKPLGSPAGEKTTLPYCGKMSVLQSLLSFCRGMKQSSTDILRKHERETRTASGFVASGQGARTGIRVWLRADRCPPLWLSSLLLGSKSLFTQSQTALRGDYGGQTPQFCFRGAGWQKLRSGSRLTYVDV